MTNASSRPIGRILAVTLFVALGARLMGYQIAWSHLQLLWPMCGLAVFAAWQPGGQSRVAMALLLAHLLWCGVDLIRFA